MENKKGVWRVLIAITLSNWLVTFIFNMVRNVFAEEARYFGSESFFLWLAILVIYIARESHNAQPYSLKRYILFGSLYAFLSQVYQNARLIWFPDEHTREHILQHVLLDGANAFLLFPAYWLSFKLFTGDETEIGQ